jgi:hypothetical protein
MAALFDAFFRAWAYCLMPRVIMMSLLPLVLLMGAGGVLAWLYWEVAVAAIRAALEESATWGLVLGWLESLGASGLRAVLAPLILVALAVPVLVVACLLLVAQFMTPALVRLVAQRRFAQLEPRGTGMAVWALARAVGLSAMAVAVIIASLPLWVVPPLAILVPPVVWGWLSMQVLSYDVLAEHAQAGERRALMREYRGPLLAMGVASGLLGSAPAAVWALSALTLVLAPLVLVLSVWLYTAVFTFTSLWFAHFLLQALHRHRLQQGPVPTEDAASPPGQPPAQLPT